MTLRYRPAEAGRILSQTGNISSRLQGQLNNLFSSVGYLEDDRRQIYYRPAYFAAEFLEHQKTINSVYAQCSFGKTHRSFGAFYDLYLIQMNNLNYYNALNGPGLEYKDGKLARLYINRIIDSSHDMLSELSKIEQLALTLKADLQSIPADYDADWRARHANILNMVNRIINDIDTCQGTLAERIDSGEKLMYAWFPEEASSAPVVARPVSQPAFARSQAVAPVVEEVQAQGAQEQDEAPRQQGTKDNPYNALVNEKEDVIGKLKTSRRSEPTFFNVAVPEGGIGKNYVIRLETDSSLDFDTHVRARQGDRVIFSREETRDYTPHTIHIVPSNRTDNIEIEIQYWEHNKQPESATLEVKLVQWDDGGV